MSYSWEPYVPDHRGDLHRLVAKTIEVLAVDSAWTKGSLARNAAGKPVMSDDPDATCWCLAGAFRKARDLLEVGWGPVWDAERLVGELRNEMASTYNDAETTTILFIRRLLQEMLDKTAPTA